MSIFEYLPDWLNPPESLGADQQVSAEEPAMVPQSAPDPQAQQEAVNYYAAKDAEQQAQQQASEPSTGSYEIPQELPVDPPKSFPSPKEWLAMKNERQKVTPIPDVMIPQQQPNMTPAQKETMDNALASMGESPVYDVMSAIGVAPAVETGLDFLSYLDKPRGAVAGAIKAGIEGGDVLQGAGEGWNKNTSYGDVVIPEKVQKEHPYLSLAGSMTMDTLLDPVWLFPPAKLANAVGQVGRATRAGVALGRAVDAASDTKFGKWAEAVKQDMLGESRIEDLQDAYTRGRSFDSVQADDVRDAVKSVEKEHGKYAGDKVAEYVEAPERTAPVKVEAPDYASDFLGDANGINGKTWYHGTGTPNLTPDSLSTNSTNIEGLFGHGLYLTDNPKIAEGYAAARSRRSGTPTIYEAKVNVGNVLDLEKPMPDNALGVFSNAAKYLGIDGLPEEIASMRGAKGEEVYRKLTDAVSEVSHAERIPASEFAEFFKDLSGSLRSAGYDAFTHVGGKRTGNKAHQVLIMLDPADELAQTGRKGQVSRFSPADFVQKTAIDSLKDGSLAAKINNGVISREQAFNAIRDSGEAVPSYLLQQHQIDAKLAGETIPDYVYRDEILSGVGNEHLRKVIQTVGDKFIDMNKANTERLAALGKLGDEALAHFPDGSHLRRSNEKYTDPEKYLKELEKNGNPDEYARAYEDIYGKRVSSGIGDSNHKIPVKDFTQRQELSTDTLNKLGVIGNTEYRMADTLNRGSKSIRESEFLNDVAAKWGVDGQEAGKLSMNLPDRRKYVKIQESEAFGDLAGKWVPKDVAEQVSRALGNRNPGEIAKAWEKTVSWWKVAKLAAPSPVFRNFYSGLPMANVYGDVPLHQIPKYMAKVTNEYARNGKKNAPLIREMREQGLFGNNWQKAEMNNILNGTEWRQFKEGGKKVLHGDVTEAPAAAANLVKAGANKSMEAFGAPDQFWRGVVYAYHRDHGKTAAEAAKMANRAMFDYNKAPEFINSLARTGIVPFAKFPYFAARETARALWNKPASVSTWVRPSYQDDQRQEKLAVLPDYLKNKTMMPLGKGTRMVNGKPVPVENNLDVSYIMPFLNDVSLGNPALEMLQIARTGKNSVGMDVIKDGMTDEEKRDAYIKQLGGAIGPSMPLPIPGNYAFETLKNGYYGKTDAKGRQYDFDSALAQSLLGLRNMPINYEEQTANSLTRKDMELRDNKAMLNRIKKDKSLSDEEREAKIADHKKQENQLKWERSVILDAGRHLGYRGK